MIDPVAPTAKLLFAHPAHFIALGGGAGLSPTAPGTVGTLLAFPFFFLLQPYLTLWQWLGLLVTLFAVGVWACEVTGKSLNALGHHEDHGGMVWDEVVAFLLVLVFTPDDFTWQVFAFLLFRFFDIVKPQPIRHFDKTMKGGLGVMFDDILAAFYALLCLAVWKAVMA